MTKGTVDLSKTILELSEEHENFPETMKTLGFDQITKPGMLQSMGRIMTIPKGCRAKGKELEDVKQQLSDMGYTVIHSKEEVQS